MTDVADVENYLNALQESKRKTMHFFHFVLTVIFIPWLAVWIYVAYNNSRHNEQVELECFRFLAENAEGGVEG